MSSTPTPRDKRTSLDEAVSRLSSGMTIGIGGWGSRRKPMALVRAILRREDLTDLTVITYGGPDLGLLCSAGKVSKAYYGFVTLDSAPFYDPWFARRRTEGSIISREMDEGMVRAGLTAAHGAGADVLSAGGSAVDAVCAAVGALEDDPLFNAGRGAASSSGSSPMRRLR